MNVHYFGPPIPLNPDNVPENQFYGSGSERPVGFTFSNLFKLYWTVRNYLIDVSVVTQNDPLAQFLSGGGATSILGAITGLSGIDLGFNSRISGYTKIKTAFTQKKRKGQREPNQTIDIYTMDGVIGGLTQKKITTGNNLPTLTSSTGNVNEGMLASAGPIHILNQNGGGVTIDFTNVKFYQGLYWPKIVVNLVNATSVSGVGTYGQMIGGVSMDLSTKIIPLFSKVNNPLAIASIAYGSILIGKRCGDRFYYDDKDKERKEAGCPGLN